jgi:hypothetical protein
MYDQSDPRSTLLKTGSKVASSHLSEPEYGLFYKDGPGEDGPEGRTWYCRGQNFIIAYTEAKPGAVFAREGQVDEYMAMLLDADAPVVANAGSQEEKSDGNVLLIMPPGSSRLTLPKGGVLVRLFSTRSADLAAKCANNAAYAQQHPTIPPFQAWPPPPDGYRIRVYSLDVTLEPGQFGRIWRCTTFMVNIPFAQHAPRDRSKLSPHSHDDFEQCSLALAGDWEHHMRWPWGVDQRAWHADVHAMVGSPSVTVIPAQVIHTSVWGEGHSQLVDIFAPPRVDFSMKPGWVRNGDEYPMPAQTAEAAE